MKARNGPVWRTVVPPLSAKASASMLAVLILIVPIAARTASVTVGGVDLSIPNPNGFAPLTPQMKWAYEVEQQTVLASVDQLGAYIQESEIGEALDDAGSPNLSRAFSVQVSKALVDRNISPADFSDFKSMARSRTEEGVRQQEQRWPHLVEKLNNYLSRRNGIEQTLSIVNIIVLPPHAETAHSIAFSIYEKYSAMGKAGAVTTRVAAGTTALVYIKGKILILHCLAEEDGLEWSRAAIKAWAAAIVAANST